MKSILRALFAETIEALHQRQAAGMVASLAEARVHAERGGRVLLVAFGKAAPGMARTALSALPAGCMRGVVVPPSPSTGMLPPLELLPGSHPLPDAGSFAAARRALALCTAAGPADQVVFLVSGGGSALMELPYRDEIPVAAWQRFYAALVGSGAGITRINALRRRVSAVKGGRLALAAARAAGQSTLLVRDVPGSWGDIASGPTWLDESPSSAALWLSDADFAAEIEALGLHDAVPAQVLADLGHGALPPRPAVPQGLIARCRWQTLLDETDARDALIRSAKARGFCVQVDEGSDEMPVDAAAERLLARLDALHAASPTETIALIATGELTVRLPAAAGRGGRNQHLVLACAQRIAGRPITVLSAGTDGIDGNSPAAGAVADGETAARAAALGLDLADAWQRCDAYPLFEALGDAIHTGPTGTNVRDVHVLLHGPDAAAPREAGGSYTGDRRQPPWSA